MKLFTLILFSVLAAPPVSWHHNLDEAKQLAGQEHRYIILNFSGSDWCGPCIQMHREFFDSKVFQQLADTALVLVNADFPRLKKNRLPAGQQQLNNAMADQYNAQGKFPYTVLLDADGHVLKDWDGMPSEKPEAFCHEIRDVIDARQ